MPHSKKLTRRMRPWLERSVLSNCREYHKAGIQGNNELVESSRCLRLQVPRSGVGKPTRIYHRNLARH